jgi:cold shock protein
MQQGTVTFFNEVRGFGFIMPDGGGNDIFVHTSNCLDRIKEGDSVTFEILAGKKGPEAQNVRRA